MAVEIFLHHIDPLLLVVKDDEGFIDEEVEVRCSDGVEGNLADVLVETDQVIGHKADGTTRKGQVASHLFLGQTLEIVQGVLLDGLAIIGQETIFKLDFKDRIIGHDGKTGILLVTGDGLQYHLVLALNPHIGQNRGQGIGC